LRKLTPRRIEDPLILNSTPRMGFVTFFQTVTIGHTFKVFKFLLVGLERDGGWRSPSRQPRGPLSPPATASSSRRTVLLRQPPPPSSCPPAAASGSRRTVLLLLLLRQPVRFGWRPSVWVRPRRNAMAGTPLTRAEATTSAYRCTLLRRC